jgi:hypothetical protein
LWRRLPGPWPVRVAFVLGAAAIAVSVLFLLVFPWAEQFLGGDVTLR